MAKRIRLTAWHDSVERDSTYVFSVPKDWLEKTLKQEYDISLDALDKKDVEVIENIVRLARYNDVFRYEGGRIREIELMSQRDIIKRWPRIIAHLICESLGYFTPRSAANALENFKKNEPFYCEWYCHMANHRSGPDFNKSLVDVGRDTLKRAIEQRRRHKGYMRDYELAQSVVAAELDGKSPEFASWF